VPAGSDPLKALAGSPVSGAPQVALQVVQVFVP